MKTSIILIALLLSSAAFASVPQSVMLTIGGPQNDGQAQQFQAIDSAGQGDIAWMAMWFGDHLAGWPGTPGLYSKWCMIFYTPGNNLVYLMDQNHNFVGGYAPGTDHAITTTFCNINTLQVSKQNVTTTLNGVSTPAINLAWVPHVTSIMTGTFNVGLEAQNNAGQDNGASSIENYLTYSNGAPCTTPPTAALVSPAQNGSGSTLTFDISATSCNGQSDVAWQWIGVGSHYGWLGAGECPLFFSRVGTTQGTVSMLNDAGSAWTGGLSIGIPGTVQNSQCSFDTATATSIVINGIPHFRGTLNMKSSFTGLKNISVDAWNNAGNDNPQVPSGTWTIPPMNYTKPDAAASYSIDTAHPRMGTDPDTGQPVPLPTDDNPLMSINLSTASADNPYSVHFNEAITVSIRNAAPNTQVWGRYHNLDPFAHFPDGSIQAYYWAKPTSNNTGQDTFTGLDFNGGWLLGYTDSTGYFIQTYMPFSLYGDNSISLFLGNLSGTYTANLPDNNFAGAVSFWVTDGTGSPAPPAYSAVHKRGKLLAKVQRADMFSVRKSGSTYEKVGDKWEYVLDLDTTTANIIRVGHDGDWSGDPFDTTNPNFKPQHGWDSADGWMYTPQALRSEHSKFRVVSDWLPGPVSVMFAESVPEPNDLTGIYADDMAIARQGGILKNSVKKNVIGPAIPPNSDAGMILALIRSWVDQGNHFLIPLVKEGLDLKTAIGEIKGLQDGYETNVVNCIKTALEALETK